MDDLLSEFLTETSESLATLDVELVNLERNPNDWDILSNIFRLVHTIKGTCGFLGLPRLEKLAHAAENVLGKFRDGALTVSADYVTLILSSIDQIKEILGYLEANETEPDGDDNDLIVALNAVAEGRAPAVDTTPGSVDDAVPSNGADAIADKSVLIEPVPHDDDVIAAPTASPQPPATSSAPVAEKPKPTAGKAKEGAGKESSVASQSIRVNVELLENLMTLVSELVLTRNQLLQMVRGQDDSEFAAPLQRLSHITTDLQEGVMKTRMQPIGNAWAKLPRIVRDLAIETGKKIDLKMYGAETELDRQVLELIKDPLTHMVRNSADHGLEGSDDRQAAGKPEVGSVKLNAFHEGGHIIIEIADDGRGLNIERIREKVVINGLATDAEISGMNDQQIAQFIFKAGFSTAEEVTSVSGRGVGMDVVRNNIEKIGGTIELKTAVGKGTTFTIKIPLTLAIVSALIVECASERFAIPQISVLELVRVTANSETTIETINNAPVLRLRDRLLPLVTLSSQLSLRKELTEATEGDLASAEEGRNETFIVVTQVGTYSFGIIVDRVFDTEEIVVKPVAPILRHVSAFSGNTILGDGSVIMILDPNGIAAVTGEVMMGDQHATTDTTRDPSLKTSDDITSLLIFRVGDGELRAVPLALVARLEEIDLSVVENSFGKPVVQYRDCLMPLITINDSYVLPTEGCKPVLVFSDRKRFMGLVVDEIVDIVEDRLNVELQAPTPGVIGTAVIGGKATDVIDAAFYLTEIFQDWLYSVDGDTAGSTVAGDRSVLLVDDSAFFQNLLTPLLSVAGYTVTAVDSAEKALRILGDDSHFDCIISDIEMPGMDGFEFAQIVRADVRFNTVPLVALSSRLAKKDFERGREVGYDDYVAKGDRDSLLAVLGTMTGRQDAAHRA